MRDAVLLVDDDERLLRLMHSELLDEGLPTVAATTGADALRLVEEDPPAAVVLDLNLPDMSGKELLEHLRRGWPRVPVVVLTAEGAISEVVECVRLGATDYVQKPFDCARLVTSITNALERGALQARVRSLTRELRRSDGFATLGGESPALRRAVELLRRAAESDVTLLLEGESGTGKEVAARAVHAESARCGGPFVAINCGAIPEGLIESELFGHERGAFTGAVAARSGCFEQAAGGTLFLDEVGELRADLQVRLLRVLQELRVTRVGGARPRPVDVRVVAATNRDLRARVAERQFREDLYYRLAVFPVRLPPLRERQGDVLLLAHAFVRRFALRHGRTLRGLSAAAREALEAYPWPGNVRELENVLERAVILEDGPEVALASLPEAITAGGASAAAPGVVVSPATPPGPTSPGPTSPGPVSGAEPETLDEAERRVVERALREAEGNVKAAARRLGIGRATIYRKIERHGIAVPGRARPSG